MTMQKSVLKVVPGLMAVGVLGRAAGMAKKSLKQKKKFKTKNLIKGSAEILIGTALITPTAQMIQSID